MIIYDLKTYIILFSVSLWLRSVCCACLVSYMLGLRCLSFAYQDLEEIPYISILQHQDTLEVLDLSYNLLEEYPLHTCWNYILYSFLTFLSFIYFQSAQIFHTDLRRAKGQWVPYWPLEEKGQTCRCPLWPAGCAVLHLEERVWGAPEWRIR